MAEDDRFRDYGRAVSSGTFRTSKPSRSADTRGGGGGRPHGGGGGQDRSNEIADKINREREAKKKAKDAIFRQPVSVPTQKGMTAQQQFAQSMQQAGAVTYGGLSGQSLWDKSPVLYEERLKKAVGPAGRYEEETDRFDPTSKKIGQVDLSQTTVGGTEKLAGLTPYYSTMNPDAFNTGNAKWKAEMKALAEGKSEEEALAIGNQVNEIFNEAIADRDRGDYTKLKIIMSGENEALNAIVPGGEKGIGWYTGTPRQEYGMHGAYLGQDPHTGKMYDIPDPTPGILANQASAAGGAGGPGGGGWGGYGGGGGGGYGWMLPGPGHKPEQMAGFYTPQANLQQAMINVHGTPTVFKKRGGIVSLLELRS